MPRPPDESPWAAHLKAEFPGTREGARYIQPGILRIPPENSITRLTMLSQINTRDDKGGGDGGITAVCHRDTSLDSTFWIFFKINLQNKQSKGMPGRAGCQGIVIDRLI